MCGHPCSAMCCDPCKCHICDSRLDGSRALLKPSAPLNGPRRSAALPRLRAYDQQALFSTPQTSKNSDSTGSGVGSWQAYVNGGAQADDARFLRKAQEEEAKYVEAMSQRLTKDNEDPNPAMSFSSAQSTILEPSTPRRTSNQANVASRWNTPSPETVPSKKVSTKKAGILMYPATPRTGPLDPENSPSPSKLLIELSPPMPKKPELADSPPKPLIQFSPAKKPSSSSNTDLLIDLGMDDISQPPSLPASVPQFRSSRSKTKKKGPAGSSSKPLNLLD